MITRNHARSGLLALSLVSLALAPACNNDPAKDKPTAQVAAPVAVPAAQPATAAKGSARYTFSQAESKLTFVGAKVTKKHDGSFATFSGTIDVADGDPTKGTVTAEVDTASLSADEAKLTAHLKSKDFFDVEKFPKAKFTSTSIKVGGENGATHTVTGNLELHGVTKSITFPAKIKATADQVDVDAEFVINRKDFAIVYPGMPDDLIKDSVALKLAVKAKKSAS